MKDNSKPLFKKIDELKESIEKITDIVTHGKGGIVELSQKAADNLPRGRLVPKNIKALRDLIDDLPHRSKVIDIGSCVGRNVMAVSDIIIKKKLNIFCLDGWDSEGYVTHWNMNSKDIFLQFAWNVQLIKEYIKVINYDPCKSINLFDDNSVDMIIVDRQFNFEISKEALEIFHKKLKVGGIMFILLNKDNVINDFLKDNNDIIDPIKLDSFKDKNRIALDILAFYKK